MLDYPSKEGKWSWEELELLAKSLGYHHKIFIENVDSDVATQTCVKSETLKALLESDVFSSLLNKTFNHQNGAYNVKVLIKSTELLTKRYISFSLLRMARVAFQTYEHSDQAGLEDKAVLRALQLCGRIMSPVKLKQILLHMGRLVADRLMLYEFLDLLATAHEIDAVDKDLPEKKVAQPAIDERDLYELCNFVDELSTQEQRYYRFLDDQYEDSRRIISMDENENCPRNKKGSGLLHEWVTPPLVNQSVRKEMTSENKKQRHILTSHVDATCCDVRHVSYTQQPCTCVPGLKVPAVKGKVKCTKVVGGVNQGEGPSLSSFTPRRLSPIVSQEDKEDITRKIESIKWDIATQSSSLKKRMGVGSTRK